MNRAANIGVEERERPAAGDASSVPAHNDLPARDQSWSLAHLCVFVFAAGFLLFAVLPESRLVDFSVPFGAESVRIARSLAKSGTFADPFAVMRTGPTAHVAPVYPFLYSLFLRAFGTGYAALLILWAWNVGLLALQMALLPWFSSRLGLGALPGLIAAGLGTISLHAPIDTEWECFLAGTMLLATCMLTENVAFWRRWSGAALLGVLWGVLILTNPVTVLLLAAWPVVRILARPRVDRAPLASRFALMAGAAMLTIAPWIARNYVRFGAFVFVRDPLGMAIYTANNPCAQPTLQEEISSGCHAKTHPNPTASIAAQLVGMGEVPFNRANLHEALQWMNSNRSAFLILTAQRFRQFWLPDLSRRWEEIPVWAVTFLALIGLFVLARENQMAAWLIASAWALFPLTYYVVASEPRYGYPIYWTLLLPAGCALAKLLAPWLDPEILRLKRQPTKREVSSAC